ncbi:hypothetical protein NKH77_43540 [Streptomyces sp. M19]
MNGRPVTVLNGFLPSLAEGYRRPGALVGLLECHSEREVAALRGELLGALHPFQAAPGTLRGTLGALGRSAGSTSPRGATPFIFRRVTWRECSRTGATSAPPTDGPGEHPLGRSLAGAGADLAAVAALAADRDLGDGAGETVARTAPPRT